MVGILQKVSVIALISVRVRMCTRAYSYVHMCVFVCAHVRVRMCVHTCV